MKKLLILFAFAIALMILISGCSQKNNTPAVDGSTNTPAVEVVDTLKADTTAH